jgi:hypothetical protein
MSEAMISESIVEAEWILQGYWTRMRYPYQTDKSGWSDIDVLAYNPESKHLVISESKVRGPKKDIFAYTEHTKSTYGTILEYDNNNYFSFLESLPKICSDKVIFSDFTKMVKKLTIQLVSNYVIDDSLKKEAEKTVLNRVHELIPESKAKIDVRLDSTMDVIAKVVELENLHGQGRRYGHPMLDIAREINRYSKPNVRFAGQGKEKTNAIKEQAIRALKNAFE